MKLFFILILFLAVHIVSSVNAEECRVYDTYTEQILIDSDCDMFPDIDDNCPYTYNPDQMDTDGDGTGDACHDNYQANIPAALERETDGSYVAGSRAPSQHLDFYEETQLAEHTQASALYSSVQNDQDIFYYDDFYYDGDSAQPYETAYAADFSGIKVQYISANHMVPGELGENYIVRIHNRKSYPVVANMTVSDITSWGSYQIRPSGILTIVPGKTESYFIYVKADFKAAVGEKIFTATVSVDDIDKHLELYADIIGRDSAFDIRSDGLFPGTGSTMATVLIVLVIVMLLLGIAGGYERLRKR